MTWSHKILAKAAGSFDSAFIQKKLIDFSKKYDLDFIQSAGTTYEIMLNDYVKKGTIAAVCAFMVLCYE